MFDFDAVEGQELSAGDVLVPEGDEETLSTLGGFLPAQHARGLGAGGRLRLLCFHGGSVNKQMMGLQMRTLLGADTTLKDMVEFECVDGPIDTATAELAGAAGAAINAAKEKIKPATGQAMWWYTKAPINTPNEYWAHLDEGIAAGIDHIVSGGPWDGLVGFSQGAELLVQIARLAEQGNPDLQRQFKFMICMAGRLPKPSLQPERRPTNTLKVPTCFMLETNGDAYPPTDYEDHVLYWDPAFREAIFHDQGHKPPRLAGSDLARFSRFLRAFHENRQWSPSPVSFASEPAALQGRSLPLARRTPAVLSPPSPARPLPVIFFGDRTEHARLLRALQNDGLGSVLALDLADPALEEVGPDEWHPCPLLRGIECLPDRLEALADSVVDGILRENGCHGSRPVVVAGIGYGAYLALRYARALRASGGFPWRLYAIRPPALFPVPETGVLGCCDMVCVLQANDTAGERWRFAIATRGPYRVLPSTSDAWDSVVAKDLLSTFPVES